MGTSPGVSMGFQPILNMWSAFGTASAICFTYVLYLVSIGVHRLYFSQYAKFPGPKLAALIYGYMFYYDAIAGKGQYIYKIKELHEQYSKSRPILFSMTLTQSPN